MKKIKKYLLSETALNSLTTGDSQSGNFDKCLKDNQVTTWLFLHENEMKYLHQFNIDKLNYCGFLTEPYLLFLDQANNLAAKSGIIKKSLKFNIVNEFDVKENFKLSLLNQEIFDDYLIMKINFTVFAVMSLECYLNNLLPDKIIFNGYDKKIIEHKFSIKQKISEIIPTFKIIDNIRNFQQKYSEVLKLVELRNNLVHLKTKEVNMLDSNIKHFETILKLDAKKEFLKVSSLINLIDSLPYS